MADCKENTEETDSPQPAIIMKVDAPEESSESSLNDDTEGQSNEENSEAPSSPCRKVAKIHCPVLAASKFGNSFGVSEFSSSAKPKNALLRPSALSSLTATSPGPSSKEIQPPKFNNPFTKVSDDAAIDGNDATNNGETEKKDETKVDNTKNDDKTSDDTPPKFLPLVASTKDNENSVNYAVASNSSTPSFVFGQNLKERVTVSSDPESSGSSEKEESKEEAPSTNENGSSELLFSNAATVCRSTTRSGLTLTQAAQEMEEANRANKRKYSQVTPLTGEEGETNVLQINCKLFAFDKATSSWQERGRGTLRLNDRDEESRIVGRAAGTQRLVLNTKVWPGMTAERAGPKSLRLTAMDVQGDIKIFIVQAAPKEVDELHSLLLQRLKRATERQPKKLATDH